MSPETFCFLKYTVIISAETKKIGVGLRYLRKEIHTDILTKGKTHKWVQVGHEFLVYTGNCGLRIKPLVKGPVLY